MACIITYVNIYEIFIIYSIKHYIFLSLLGEITEVKDIESLKYTFSTVRASTNYFYEDNKLGEGGFGAVYKV